MPYKVFTKVNKSLVAPIIDYGAAILDLSRTAKSLTALASRELGLIISKIVANGKMPYKVFTNVYESLVAPVIDYGAEIRALRELYK